jgi:5'-nucleotidase
VTIEEMYNIFPFDNSITKMQLSGLEVQQMYDFVARRSSARGCVSQAQIAGSRVVINCTGCNRKTLLPQCNVDADCPDQAGTCDPAAHTCQQDACAEQVYVGFTTVKCQLDSDCKDAEGNTLQGGCNKLPSATSGVCMQPIDATGLYELATSNYLAAGGSGFRVLQRNTTQFDTKIQQRDALIDYMRQGKPCGYDPVNNATPDGLKACGVDADCTPGSVCACPGNTTENVVAGAISCVTSGSCDPSVGRCVRADCRDLVAAFHDQRCTGSTSDTCRADLGPCQIGGESCKILACVDETMGASTDNRVEMLGR